MHFACAEHVDAQQTDFSVIFSGIFVATVEELLN
jgi:hypothetical protein